MKVLTTTGLTKLIELSKNTFLDKDNVIDVSDALATVAVTGSYNDLTNKPTINDLTTSAQQAALNSGATSTNIAQITTNTNNITTINNKIPTAATSSNQLADKAFVNSSIANMAANYVTSDAQGDNFTTKAALLSGPYYHKGVSYTLTNNDYALVESDETKNGATTRYIYDGAQWAFQYIINDTPFTQAQLDAINSTITSTKVNNYDTHIADTTIHVTAANKTTWNNKQNAITSSNKLSSDLVDDTDKTNKFVTSTEKTNWNNKVDKTSTANQLYGTSTADTQTTVTYGTATTANYIVQRDSSGQIYVKTPNNNNDAVNKKYVDDGLNNKQATLVSGTNIKTINNQSVLGSGNLNLDGLPSQSGQSGKYLTTDGTTASWATVDALPSQTSQSGKFLTTNGTTASWATVDALPSQSGQSGKYLTTNGTVASWATVGTLPSQSGNNGKFLTTNGSAASWASLATVATSGSYNDLSNKLTAGTDITISSNQISCTYPEVYITEEDYQDLVDAGTVDPNTYYNTDDATQMTVTDFITKKDSMNPGDQLPQGYLVFVEVQ